MNSEIVKRGTYEGYEYFIVFVGQMWYCAYVILPDGNKYYGVEDYYSIPIEVHGGLTFADNHRLVDGQWCIGWDYAHLGDYIATFGDYRDDLMTDGFGMPPHRWSPDEIEYDCKDVIDQLVKLENGETPED